MSFLTTKKRRNFFKTKINLTTIITLVFLCFGVVFLLSSVLFSVTSLAFIGITLLFWAIIFLYIQPEKHIKKSLMDAVLAPQSLTINQLIRELGYKGKPIYLPSGYFKTINTNKLFLSKDDKTNLPPPGNSLNLENEILLTNSKSLLLNPSGLQLSHIFQRRFDKTFSKSDLTYIQQKLQEIITQDLELARKFELAITKNQVSLKINQSIFTGLQNYEKSIMPNIMGCPICSAVACILTNFTGKPLVVEAIENLENGKVLQVTLRFLDNVKIDPIPISEPQLMVSQKSSRSLRLLPKMVALIQTTIGSLLLVLVAFITLNDFVNWGKDIPTIFFGSRSGELLSLGIDMTLIYYLLIGLILVIFGFFTYFLKERIFDY
ncbi:MAG: hypothetical protein JXA91_08345 [Candidatus Thermoplasmatota archaeon]|nr:hypothetical protein [Candidatus Thermoplasmatota archaeon]